MGPVPSEGLDLDLPHTLHTVPNREMHVAANGGGVSAKGAGKVKPILPSSREQDADAHEETRPASSTTSSAANDSSADKLELGNGPPSPRAAKSGSKGGRGTISEAAKIASRKITGRRLSVELDSKAFGFTEPISPSERIKQVRELSGLLPRRRTALHRTAPHRTAPHRTAPHRTAPHATHRSIGIAGGS